MRGRRKIKAHLRPIFCATKQKKILHYVTFCLGGIRHTHARTRTYFCTKTKHNKFELSFFALHSVRRF